MSRLSLLSLLILGGVLAACSGDDAPISPTRGGGDATQGSGEDASGDDAGGDDATVEVDSRTSDSGVSDTVIDDTGTADTGGDDTGGDDTEVADTGTADTMQDDTSPPADTTPADTTPLNVCGDGVAHIPETCDGDDLGGRTCELLGHRGGTLRCAEDCTLDISGCLDDVCGDGEVTGDEACELSRTESVACAELGFAPGTAATAVCQADCTFDSSACQNSICGNGNLELGYESCDGAALGEGTCGSEGFYGGSLNCGTDCTYDTSACVNSICGDGHVESGFEDCDGDNLGADSCRAHGLWGGTLSCNGDCTANTDACVPNICGNGTIEGDEVCDGAFTITTPCSMREGFVGGLVACTPDCMAEDYSGCLFAAEGSDEDSDGVPDLQDNCPSDANPRQLDSDRDGIGNGCDLPFVVTGSVAAGTTFGFAIAPQELIPTGTVVPTPVSLDVESLNVTYAVDDEGVVTVQALSVILGDGEVTTTLPDLLGTGTPTDATVGVENCHLDLAAPAELELADALESHRRGEWVGPLPGMFDLACDLIAPDGTAGPTTVGGGGVALTDSALSIGLYDSHVTFDVADSDTLVTNGSVTVNIDLLPGFPFPLPVTFDFSGATTSATTHWAE